MPLLVPISHPNRMPFCERRTRPVGQTELNGPLAAGERDARRSYQLEIIAGNLPRDPFAPGRAFTPGWLAGIQTEQIGD